MRISLLAIAACAAIASATAANAAQLDGKLPMYPSAKLDPRESVPPNVIAQGAPLVLLTSDSVSRVDKWYASNAPKACTRTAQGGAVKYACPGGSVMIYNKGGTQIALVPAFPRSLRPGGIHTPL